MLRQSGIASVYVDLTVPAGGVAIASVQSDAPLTGVPVGPAGAFGLRDVVPNPFHAIAGASAAIARRN